MRRTSGLLLAFLFTFPLAHARAERAHAKDDYGIEENRRQSLEEWEREVDRIAEMLSKGESIDFPAVTVEISEALLAAISMAQAKVSIGYQIGWHVYDFERDQYVWQNRDFQVTGRLVDADGLPSVRPTAGFGLVLLKDAIGSGRESSAVSFLDVSRLSLAPEEDRETVRRTVEYFEQVKTLADSTVLDARNEIADAWLRRKAARPNCESFVRDPLIAQR